MNQTHTAPPTLGSNRSSRWSTPLPRFAAWCFLLGLLAAAGVGCQDKEGGGEPAATEGGSETTEELEGCPTHIRAERVPSLAQRSLGWNGFGHGIVPVSGMPLSFELFDCDPECRRCRVKGPAENAPDVPTDNQLCVQNFPQQCSTDADCGEGDVCRFFFGPPAQGEMAWTGNYVVPLTPEQQAAANTEFADGIQGVFDFLTGELDFALVNLRVVIGLGTAVSCVGDLAVDDGVRDGVCEGTQTPCDVNATTEFGTLSFDCEFTPLSFQFDLPSGGMTTAGRRWTLDDTRPMCTTPGEEDLRCWCSVCANDERRACISDADCPGSTCGAAEVGGTPIVIGQDNCADGQTCIWDGTTLLGSCLDDNGTNISCFPTEGELSVEGSTSVQDGFYVSTLAILSCIPKIDSPETFFDGQFGFPGPIAQRLPFTITPEYR